MSVSQTHRLDDWTRIDPAIGHSLSPMLDLGREAPPEFNGQNITNPRDNQRTFRGRFTTPGVHSHFPEQTFIESKVAGGITLISHPEGKWPRVFIEFAQDASSGAFRCKRVRIWSPDDSVASWLLSTRFMFCLALNQGLTLTDDHGAVLVRLVPKSEPSFYQAVRSMSSIARKLAYIESIFSERFSIPEVLSFDTLWAMELVYRAITKGEFKLRSGEITFRQLIPKELHLNSPPFSGPGSFSRRVDIDLEQMTQPLLGKRLYLGPYTITVEQSELANRRALDNIGNRMDQPIDLRFIVYNNQVSYSFDCHNGKDNRKVSTCNLNEFKQSLSAEEPEELVNLIDESLQMDVSSYEATQIAVGWLQYHDFPDRYCAQEPVLETND